MSKRLILTPSLAAVVAVFGLACSSVQPPKAEISTAEMAIRQAESAGAVELASLPMRIARENLEEAKAIVQKEKGDQLRRARRLAENATVEAQLAEQSARTAASVKSRDEAQKTIDAMRSASGLTPN